MKRPAIANLSSNQRRSVIIDIKKDKTYFPHKETAIETLNFVDELLEDLQTSKIKSISELRKILVIRAENVKKIMQNQ